MAAPSPAPSLTPAQLRVLRRRVTIAIVVPTLVAIALVVAEVGPAAWAIDYFADVHGQYSLRAVVMTTVVVMLGFELLLLLPVVLVVTVLRKLRAR